MRQLQPVIGGGHPLQLIPTAAELVEAKQIASSAGWNRDRSPAEIILELWASEPCTADVALFAATSHLLRFEPLELIVDGDRLVSKSNHKLVTGDGPFFTTTGVGGEDVVPYWVEKVDGKSLRLSSNLDALLGGSKSGIPSAVASKGTTSLIDTCKPLPNTPAAVGLANLIGPQRLCWALVDSFDAAKLGPQEGIRMIERHTPRTLAYAIVGTATPHGAHKDKVSSLIVHGSIWPLREV